MYRYYYKTPWFWLRTREIRTNVTLAHDLSDLEQSVSDELHLAEVHWPKLGKVGKYCVAVLQFFN